MNCTYCGAELDKIDEYGRLAYHQDGKVIGEIFKCPNNEGFRDEKEAKDYLENTDQNLEILGVDGYRELECLNEHGNGFYHTLNGDLEEGYPC